MNLPTPDNITAVLLAAGSGTRLGLGPKALLPFRGSSLVEELAEALAKGGCASVVVVAGSGAEQIEALPGLIGQTVVRNAQWKTGMGSSLKLGISAAPPGHHIMVALVDQPGLTAQAVTRLIECHTSARITAAGYLDAAGSLRRGHPLILDAAYREAAAAGAGGDSGARLFLRARPDVVDVVDCSDLCSGADIDTPADLHLLESQQWSPTSGDGSIRGSSDRKSSAHPQ